MIGATALIFGAVLFVYKRFFGQVKDGKNVEKEIKKRLSFSDEESKGP